MPVDGNVEPTRHVVLQLRWVRDGVAVLAHIGEGPRQQIGVPLLAEAKDH